MKPIFWEEIEIGIFLHSNDKNRESWIRYISNIDRHAHISFVLENCVLNNKKIKGM